MISNSGTTSLGLYDLKRQVDAFGGVDYFRPTLSGGYLPNARVMLANGDIVQNGTNVNLTNDPNADMTGWENLRAGQIFDDSGKTQQELNNLFKFEQIIDTRKYGLVVNTELDQSSSIHLAMSSNPSARRFYIPSGTVYANIVVPRNYVQFLGDGLGVTKLIGFDPAKSTIDYAKKLYMSLDGISVFQTYGATASVVNARDSRYIVYNEAEVFQLPDALGNYSYSVRGLDLRKDTFPWTGYNYFNGSRFNRCSYGVDVDTSGDVASVMFFSNCVSSFNGYFGIKIVGAEVGGMNNCDVATNGQIGVRDGLYDETQFGGVYVSGKDFHITGSWHELNRSKFSNLDVPNDIYIHPGSHNCTERNPRSQRNNQGGYLITKSQAQQDSNGYSDTVFDSGMGVAKYNNLIKNGAFKHALNGWGKTNITAPDYAIEVSDLPLGFETGLKLFSSGGNKGVYQSIYESGKTGNIIDTLSNFIGKTITFTAWVKNLTPTTGAIRIGFDTGTSGTNVYFSVGNYISSTPNDWVQVVITHKIIGTEGRIFAGLRTTADCVFTGFRVQLGSRVAGYEPANINENGGIVYGTIDATAFRIQGQNISFSAVKPTVAGVKGDVCYNINVTTGAEIGWQYNGTAWGSMGKSIESYFASSTNFTSATSGLNTTQKWQGRTLLNSGTGKLYFALGSNPTDAWRATDGSGDIIPS